MAVRDDDRVATWKKKEGARMNEYMEWMEMNQLKSWKNLIIKLLQQRIVKLQHKHSSLVITWRIAGTLSTSRVEKRRSSPFSTLEA